MLCSTDIMWTGCSLHHCSLLNTPCLNVTACPVVSAALAVAVFRAYPEQRSTLMDEVMTTVLSKLHCSSVRGPLRLYQVTDASIKPLHIQMATALVMNFVQVSVIT